MNKDVKSEKILFWLMLIISLACWCGVAFLIAKFSSLSVLLAIGVTAAIFISFNWFVSFCERALILASLQRHAIEIFPKQLPEIYAVLQEACNTLQTSLKRLPRLFLIQGNGLFNASTSKVHGVANIVLTSEIVEAVNTNPEYVKFYIGHELGHVRRNHLSKSIWLFPASYILPLVYKYYKRSCELNCDLDGLFCVDHNVEIAQRSLLVLGAGKKLWEKVSIKDYYSQTASLSGFWTSFQEYGAAYPAWGRRVALIAASQNMLQFKHFLPNNNIFAAILKIVLHFIMVILVGAYIGFIGYSFVEKMHKPVEQVSSENN